jgi:hypothetical protein
MRVLILLTDLFAVLCLFEMWHANLLRRFRGTLAETLNQDEHFL